MKLDKIQQIRSYTYDKRHIWPLVKDIFDLLFFRIWSRSNSNQIVALGRAIRSCAFECKDDMPLIGVKDIASRFGRIEPADIKLPSVAMIATCGLGGGTPYIAFATLVQVFAPRTILEIGTFRGVGTLTMALNTPDDTRIYTLDLPEDFSKADIATLTRGDKEWAEMARDTVGIVFEQHAAASKIIQLRGQSLTYNFQNLNIEPDFCLIDGGHSYECVKKDTENCLSILPRGGIILWDDYTWYLDGVRSFLGELRKELPCYRLAGSQYVIYQKE